MIWRDHFLNYGPKSATMVTKFREKNWRGVSRDSFFLKILSPSEPILRAKIENMISSDYVLCYIPRALETLEKNENFVIG